MNVNRLIKNINQYYTNHPLRTVLAIGLLLRLIAVIFSKGFGMHDDHFLVIEASKAWVDGTEYDNWLPGSGATSPDGHSFFYSGMHFILFHILKFLKLENPQGLMIFVRFIHAMLSLATIYFGFKIANKIGGLKNAATVGLLLATLWFMPFLSVRNLIEVVCIPFLMAGTWYAMTADKRVNVNSSYYLAGLLLGIAFCIRFQTVFFVGGLGIGLLITSKFKNAFLVGLGVLSVFIITQGPIDYMVWGYPFAQFIEYVAYNIENATTYFVGAWYNYLLVILGILIPPVSMFMFYGWVLNRKKYLPAFLAVLVFLVFHSYFPNKQERFILPIIPFFVVFGISGFNLWFQSADRSIAFKKFVSGSWIFFWILNLALLPIVSTTYSKKARVEAMTFLYPFRSEIRALVTEDTNRGNAKLAPRFYLGKWIKNYRVGSDYGIDSLEIYLNRLPAERLPDYILFVGDENIDIRVENIKKFLPDIEYVTTIKPGFTDIVLHKLNSHNRNDQIYIYHIRSHPPKK
jgi:glycosyl transferase family 22 (putative mannosyltransferase)